MSNKNKATVLVYRPMGGDEDPTTGRLTPYHDIYTECQVIKWDVSPTPYIIFVKTDSTGNTTKVTSVGMPFTILEDVDSRQADLYSQEGCTCPETDGKSCPIPAHQPARPESR